MCATAMRDSREDTLMVARLKAPGFYRGGLFFLLGDRLRDAA